MNCLLISPSSSPQQSWKVRIWWMWTFPGRRALNICRILLFKQDFQKKRRSHAFFLPQDYKTLLWLSSIQLIIVLKKRLGIVYLIRITRRKQSLFALCNRQAATIPSISQLDVEVDMLLQRDSSLTHHTTWRVNCKNQRRRDLSESDIDVSFSGPLCIIVKFCFQTTKFWFQTDRRTDGRTDAIDIFWAFLVKN